MEVRRSVYLLLGGLLLLGGCRAARHNAMLEQELRMYEDRIYELQDCLQETRSSLEARSQENESLRRQLAEGRGSESSERSSEAVPAPTELKIEIPSAGSSGSGVPSLLRGSEAPSEPAGGSSPASDRYGVPPGIEGPSTIPSPASPSEEIAPPATSGAILDAPGREGPSIETTDHSAQAAGIDVGELAIEQIDGGPATTDGDGISLVVAPRDASGAPLPAAAPISVVVVDPAISGPAGRVARWDFTPEEAFALREASSLGEGFRLRLKWPRQRPAHKELHLFVRYETADGRKLHAETPFDLGQLTVAGPRQSDAPTANWQRRKAQPMPRQYADGTPASQWSGRSMSSSEAPGWGTSPAAAPGFDAPESRVPERRSPQSVASQPKAPSWSPERR
ncbi:MAG TPA: hypothetical protein VJL29_11500 [Thermoguttaceae bacterium]|nr:hypothetical protein [Thermoguttaceae bacterium]